MDKDQHIQNMFKMAEMLNASPKNTIKTVTEEVVKPVVELKTKETQNMLPTTYLSSTELKLSTKDIVHKTTYLERLKQTDERFEDLKYTEKQVRKIRNAMTRFSTGSVSVAPLTCKGSQCPFASTCVSGDTIVLIKGGRTRKIKDLKVGDIIYSYNLERTRLEEDSIIATNKIESKPVYLIKTKYGNKIKATEDHKFLSLTISQKLIWKSLDESLSVGSVLIVTDFDDDYEDVEALGDAFIDYIVSIKLLENEDVYDITINKNHNFIANNIVVHNCPYQMENVAPIDLPCPIELELIEYWMGKYIEEFNIDETSITDLHMVSRLCTYDIYEMRLHKYLALHDQTILVDFVSSFDELGNAISNKSTSAAFDTIDKIDRMRSKTLKELMATREAKTKVAQTVAQAKAGLDISDLRSKFEQLLKLKESKIINHD